MSILQQMAEGNYEEVVFCQDRMCDLRAIIAIHDTTLGPALGGIRLFPYASEEEAITDVLRLARAMTLKASLAGLDYGGGKSVVLAAPAPDKREALFRALGRHIAGLAGRYIATEDMGTTTEDLEWVHRECSWAVGRSPSAGGGGDPSPMTAWGVFQGMRACLEVLGEKTDFHGSVVAIQGLGKVGFALARFLREAGAHVVAADINGKQTHNAQQELGITIVAPDEIHAYPCDIFSPCAGGGILNEKSIPQLRCRAVAGGANNQLLREEDGDLLRRRKILYAPDFAVNAGGLIQVADEREPGGYRHERVKARTEAIYGRMKEILAEAGRRGISPHRVAVALAEERITAARKLQR